jgi:hypothetical protein
VSSSSVVLVEVGSGVIFFRGLLQGLKFLAYSGNALRDASNLHQHHIVPAALEQYPAIEDIHKYGDNYPNPSARSPCPYSRADLPLLYPRWNETCHGGIEQYNACLHCRVRWRTRQYRRLSGAEYGRGFNCLSPSR